MKTLYSLQGFATLPHFVCSIHPTADRALVFSQRMRISRVEKMTLLFEFDFSKPLNRCIIQTLCLFTTDGAFPSTSRQLLISLLSMSCCLMQQNSTFCQVDDAPSAHFCGLSVNEDISHLRKAQWFNLRKRNYSEGKLQRMCNCCEFEESTWKPSFRVASLSNTNWFTSSVWTAPGHRLTEVTPLFLSSNPISAASRSHCND